MNKRFGTNSISHQCEKCKLSLEFCFCDFIKLCDTKTRFSFLVHYKETFKSSNTSLPAYRSLINSELVLRGLGSENIPDFTIAETHKPLYLFPDNDAIDIREIDKEQGPYHIIVPDGSWRQAARTKRRFSQLHKVPSISLPKLANPKYDLRKSKQEQGMCTLEAVSLTLDCLGESEAAKKLDMLLLQIIKSVKASRGILLDP